MNFIDKDRTTNMYRYTPVRCCVENALHEKQYYQMTKNYENIVFEAKFLENCSRKGEKIIGFRLSKTGNFVQ